MKNLFFVFSFIIVMFSCNKNFYGTYNTSYSTDKSAFYQIRLKNNYSVEKTEIHVIRDIAVGKFIVEKNQITCYFDSSTTKFPPDTIVFKHKGQRLYFKRNDTLIQKKYLVKE